MALYIVSLSNTTYSLQIYGEDYISVGMNLSIHCMVLESGYPIETSDIQLYLVLPTGEMIKGSEFNTVATLEHGGTYSCIALINATLTVISYPVIIYGKA